jgi:hypothetical protein
LSGRFGREERRENLLDVFRADTGAVICHRNLDPSILVRARLDGELPTLGTVSLRDGVDCVVKEIQQDLLELGRIDPNERGPLRDLFLQPDPLNARLLDTMEVISGIRTRSTSFARLALPAELQIA